MKLQNYLFSLALFLMAVQLQAQEELFHRCASVEHQAYMNEQFPGYTEAVNKTFEQAKVNAASVLEKDSSILRIPVVVHVVYFNEDQNLPDSVIHNQIQILNEDYRRQNPDAVETRSEFLQIVGDARIEFYLADVDEQGSATDGIVRVQTSLESFLDPIGVLLGDMSSLERVKSTADGGSDPWDQDRYLNLWICDMSVPLLGPVIFGFATPPVGAPNWPPGATEGLSDGVVVQYQAIGRNNPTLNTLPAPIPDVLHKGRTATHEFGHYLGLRHIWGDGGTGLPGSGDCAADDGIEDTPNAFAASAQDCDFTKNSCPDAPIDYPDMIENYMDYADEDCQNAFTYGQIDIMRAMLFGPRAGLIEPLEVVAPVAAFEADITVANVGEDIQFTDLSAGGSDWFWTFGDGNNSVEQNPIHAYDTEGVYTVTLNVSNSAGFDFVEQVDYIMVAGSVGIEDNDLSQLISIAPNPTKGLVMIDMDALNGRSATIEVFNIAGQQVQMVQTAQSQVQLDLSAEAAGLYLVKMVVDGQVMTQKILLEK